MERKQVIICDREEAYAEGLMEQILEKEGGRYQVRIFSSLGQVFQFSRKNALHVLLLEEGFLEEGWEKIPAKKKFLLSHKERETPAGFEGCVCKYRPAGRILKVLQGVREEAGAQPAERIQRPGLQEAERTSGGGESEAVFLAVYSPVHRIGKTAFALRLAEEKAAEGPALYLNLEEYAGVDYQLPRQEKGTLAELLYYSRQETDAIEKRLPALVCQLGAVDYLQPIPFIRDLRQVEGREWVSLLEALRRRSIYRYIILDLGDALSGLFEILGLCNRIYTPFIPEPGAKAKLQHYTEGLYRMGYEEILERTTLQEWSIQ